MSEMVAIGKFKPAGGGGIEGRTEDDEDDAGPRAGTGAGAPDGAAAIELDDDGWPAAANCACKSSSGVSLWVPGPDTSDTSFEFPVTESAAL